MKETELLFEIEKANANLGNEEYVCIKTGNDKEWLISTRNFQTGILIFQSTSFRGKILKMCMSKMQKFKVLFSGIFPVKYYKIHDEILQIIKECFEIDVLENLAFSVFMGTPGIHQKIVIQISEKERIWGYCKVSPSSVVSGLFCQEVKVLRKLHEAGIDNIPKPLCLKELKEFQGSDIYIQSTIKTRESKVLHELRLEHVTFLKQMFWKTRKEMPYEESQFYNTVNQLVKSTLEFEKVNCEAKIKKSIQKTYLKGAGFINHRYAGKKMELGMMHRDFTPWNMFLEQRTLFVFDWEYASDGYPPMLDIFHFFIQTLIFGKRKTSTQIWEEYERTLPQLEAWCAVARGYQVEELFVCYLLDIIALYILRSKEIMRKDESDLIVIRSELLEKALNRLNN